LVINPKVIVEVGVGPEGRSTQLFLELCKHGIAGHLWSVDIDPEKTRPAVERIHKLGLDKYWTFTVMDALEFTQNFDETINLFYIDMNGRYLEKTQINEEIHLEIFKAYGQLMASNGVMSINNTCVFDGCRKGLIRFTEETDWQCSFLRRYVGIAICKRTQNIVLRER